MNQVHVCVGTFLDIFTVVVAGIQFTYARAVRGLTRKSDRIYARRAGSLRMQREPHEPVRYLVIIIIVTHRSLLCNDIVRKKKKKEPLKHVAIVSPSRLSYTCAIAQSRSYVST